MIDILMAVYNGEKYIKEQIESIISQTNTDWRLMIHDDGSNDKTIDIVEKYVEKYKNKIVLVSDGVKTGGAKNNFFHLMKLSNADYIMLADQDDIWERGKVEFAYKSIRQAEKYNGENIPILCHSDLNVVDENKKMINSSFFDMQKLDSKKNKFKDLLLQNNITGCTVIFNKVLNDLCISMPKEAIMHDWWLGIIAAAFGNICYMDKTAIMYRQHANNTEGAKNLKSFRYLIGKMLKVGEMKDAIDKTYVQAEKFYEIFSDKLSIEDAQVIQAYISLKKINKLERIKVIKKFGFMKTGLVRKIVYVLIV